MANTSSAKKRVRQSLKHRERNMSLKNRMRTAVKKVIKATEEKNPGQANELYRKAQPLIDSLARKGVIHKNKASNQKRKLIKGIKSIS